MGLKSENLLKPAAITGAASPAFIRAAHILLGFIAVLLVVMPWTERFWHVDDFLRGGQDLELGLLALASIFSLILVLSRYRRHALAFILAIQRSFTTSFQAPSLRSARDAWYRLVAGVWEPLVPDPESRLYNLPLQI